MNMIRKRLHLNFELISARLLISAALTVICGSPATAQSLLTGKVIDSSNRHGIQGVNLLINDSILYTTDDRGNFSFSVESFPVTVRASCVGYDSESFHAKGPGILEIELNASGYMLGEVVVSAYEKEQKLNDVAGSISLLTKNSLAEDNDINITNALNKLPGIYMHSGSYNTNRLTIRGIGSRSLFGTSKIRAYYDNIPLTSGDGETTVEDIDPGLIDRIEIIKGPSSSLYGAGLGGTLLIFSDLPSFGEKDIQYQFTGGSYGYLKNAITARAGLDKLKVLAGINKIQNNGFRENNAFERLTAGLAARAAVGQGAAVTITLNYIDQRAEIPSSLNDSVYHANPEAAAANWKATAGFEDYQKFLSGLQLSVPAGKNSLFEGSIFASFRSSYERRPFNILTEDTRALGSRFKYAYSKEIFGKEFSMAVGYEYFFDRYSWTTIENLNKSEGALLSDNRENRENLNLFLKTDWLLPTNTLLTAGLNLNMTDYQYLDIYSVDSIDNSGSYTFGRTWSPRIGLSHPILKQLHIHASLSQGFSPPSLPETLTPAGSINPDIQPETGINYEIGIRGFMAGSKLHADLSIFSLQVKNLLVARRIGDDQFIGINAGKTGHRGIEASFNYDFTGERKPGPLKLIGFATITLSDFRFREFVDDSIDYSGNLLTGVPQNEINAGLDFAVAAGFYSNMAYRYVSRISVNDMNTLFTEPYQLVNLKAGFRKSLFGPLSADIYGILNNALNEKYVSMIQVNAAAVGGNPPRYFYPGLPRNFYAGLIIKYSF
ncbi:MAG TPA: TonB-dependent receptor [Cyclobacteriaceae bacterium]|nr:TonB-dependent receptor [Cyclobacteriaceae bacterium]